MHQSSTAASSLPRAVLHRGHVVVEVAEAERPRRRLALERQRHAVAGGAAERRAVEARPQSRRRLRRCRATPRRMPRPRARPTTASRGAGGYSRATARCDCAPRTPRSPSASAGARAHAATAARSLRYSRRSQGDLVVARAAGVQASRRPRRSRRVSHTSTAVWTSSCSAPIAKPPGVRRSQRVTRARRCRRRCSVGVSSPAARSPSTWPRLPSTSQRSRRASHCAIVARRCTRAGALRSRAPQGRGLCRAAALPPRRSFSTRYSLASLRVEAPRRRHLRAGRHIRPAVCDRWLVPGPHLMASRSQEYPVGAGRAAVGRRPGPHAPARPRAAANAPASRTAPAASKSTTTSDSSAARSTSPISSCDQLGVLRTSSTALRRGRSDVAADARLDHRRA